MVKAQSSYNTYYGDKVAKRERIDITPKLPKMAPNSTFVKKAKFWLKAMPKSKTKSKISRRFLSTPKSKIIWWLLGFALSVL